MYSSTYIDEAAAASCCECCRSCNFSSSLVNGIVEWLYRPWAISCRAKGFFWPVDFLILALLFWNQIFICASFSPSSALNCCRRFSVRYRFSLNSCCRGEEKNQTAEMSFFNQSDKGMTNSSAEHNNKEEQEGKQRSLFHSYSLGLLI